MREVFFWGGSHDRTVLCLDCGGGYMTGRTIYSPEVNCIVFNFQNEEAKENSLAFVSICMMWEAKGVGAVVEWG